MAKDSLLDLLLIGIIAFVLGMVLVWSWDRESTIRERQFERWQANINQNTQ